MAAGQLHRALRRLCRLADAGDSDRHLLERFARGHDDDAFAALVGRHGPLVWGVCRRLLDHADAEDAFQATFLVLARKAGSVRWHDSIGGWLYGVAYRLAMKAKVRNARRRERPIEAAPEPAALAADPAWREVCAVLDAEVQRLPPRYRAPLVLCYLDGRTRDQAARACGWSVRTLDRRLERGKALLRRRLERRGVCLSSALLLAALAPHADAVPPLLRAATARGTMAAPALALAEALLRAMGLARILTLTATALVVAGVVAGAGVGARLWLAKVEPPAGLRHAASERGEPQRKDRYGDPLPAGAVARLGTLRFRGVRGCVTYAPDGKLIASAAGPAGNQIVLWDASTGREVRRFGGHPTIERLSFAPDGRRLVSSANELGCRVWDVVTGNELFTIPGRRGAFSGDGKFLVSVDDRSIAVFDATGKRLRQIPLQGNSCDFVVAARAPVFAVRDRDSEKNAGIVQVYDIGSGALRGTIRCPPPPFDRITLDPDGRILATAHGDYGAMLWDVAGGQLLRHWRQGAVSALAFAPDGKTLAWMDNPGGRVFTVGLHGDTPTLLGTPVNWFDTPCFSPDGKTLALLTDARVIQLRDLATAKDVGALDAHDSPVYMVAFSPDGRGVVSESLTGFIAWEIAGARLLRRTPPGDVSAEHVIRLLPDGRLLTEERWAKRYRLRDARTGAEVWRFDAKPDVGEVAIAPGGRYAALCGQSSGCCVLDLATGRCRYRSAQPVFKPHLSADGNVIVWRRHGKEAGVAVYHHETGKTRTLEDLPAETELDYWLMRLDSPVSPDGRWLVLPKDDGSLRLWDLTTGKKLLSLADVQPTVWELIWSPDGRYLATRGRSVSRFVRDREDRPDLRVWDVAAGRRLPQLTIANFQGAARFSRDGRTLLTTDLDGVIHLWEVATGKERRRLAGHLPGEIRALAFSPDGRRLASGGSDSQVLVWDLR